MSGSNLRVKGLSYLVCATQRSGSTLLCELLKGDEVAGAADEYFEALRATSLPRQPRQYFEGAAHADVAAKAAAQRSRPTRAGWRVRRLEELVHARAVTLGRVLDDLGVDPRPLGAEKGPVVRQADNLSQDWVSRFRQDDTEYPLTS